ncbi:hypothetical protein [Mesorhizobium sp. ORM16]|uniref:hypothetical protein n=1 Tax=Mesorhizobium sp. ORM16 TaxID=3376989 RepID=UPI003857BE0B
MTASSDLPISSPFWVEGAKRFQSFESFLIPAPTFDLMREEGPLPVADAVATPNAFSFVDDRSIAA